MSVVGMIHIQCGHIGKCKGHVYAVDAGSYVHDAEKLAQDCVTAVVDGIPHWSSYASPVRYCPSCESIDIKRGVETERLRDKRIQQELDEARAEHGVDEE
tara:strand:+ start:3682 stop:3981 length:300 start_codon:yes stop_codon:yes gene_type:complete